MNTVKFRKAVGISLCALICFSSASALSGCDEESSSSVKIAETTVPAPAVSTADEATAVGALESLGIDTEALGIKPDILYDTENKVGFQLELPDEGDTIGIIHTSMGDITIRFFPNHAPKAVTNFINLAKDSNYNNSTFHRIIDGFMIQGGYCGNDPDSINGTSSYGNEFEDEFCDKLFNIRGAVAMANSGTDTNGSQFFINQTDAKTFNEVMGGFESLEAMWQNIKTQLLNYKDSNLLSAFIQQNGSNCYNTDIVGNDVRALYETNGGSPYLDGAYNAVDRGHTVFGQVIDGMDVVDKIAGVKTDEENKPLENVIIESIEITSYSAQ